MGAAEIQETWKDVIGFEGFYQVSNYGRVKSIDRTQTVTWNGKKVSKQLRGRIIAQSRQNGGYVIANLSANSRRREMTIHRMVAMAFIDNPQNLKEVNHKDGNKNNNTVWNLEWCDRSENLRHRVRVLGQKGNSVPVRCIDTGKVYSSIKAAAKATGVSTAAINVALKKGYRCGGYKWTKEKEEMLVLPEDNQMELAL